MNGFCSLFECSVEMAIAVGIGVLSLQIVLFAFGIFLLVSDENFDIIHFYGRILFDLVTEHRRNIVLSVYNSLCFVSGIDEMVFNIFVIKDIKVTCGYM